MSRSTVEVIEYTRVKDLAITTATLRLKYWRAIHGEVMTHRVFSKNGASSRAMPTLKIIKNVLNDMAGPDHWGRNRSGMQADEELTGLPLLLAKMLWYGTGYIVCLMAYIGYYLGMHKQTINRMLEPWSYMTIVMTGTDWENFFNLRCHKDAQPEFRDLANKIRQALATSIPRTITVGEWHMPFVTELERKAHDIPIQRLLSVARCASTSYMTVDGFEMDFNRANRIFNQLANANPMHASPFEHQATPDPEFLYPQAHGNFRGMIQYRKCIEQKFDPAV